MNYVKRIRISGFRGILTPMTIDFTQGSGCTSMILYGSNGTGKSSITDAWEWLTVGKIEHLAREGAGARAYPHMLAKPGTTYVQVEFSNANIGVVRLDFDDDRITKPRASQNLSLARSLIPHPCHIRYGDLTRFVLMQKAERYDALAGLMGFGAQMQYHKAVRRVQSRFSDYVDQIKNTEENARDRLKKHFGLSKPDIKEALKRIAMLCELHGIRIPATAKGAETGIKELDIAVTQDSSAKELAEYSTLENALQQCSIPENLSGSITNLLDAMNQVRRVERQQLADHLRLPLFQAADQLISEAGYTGLCPLCGNRFDGDLREHIKNELSKMRELRDSLNKLRRHRASVDAILKRHGSIHRTFMTRLGSTRPMVNVRLFEEFLAQTKKADRHLSDIARLIEFKITAIEEGIITEIAKTHKGLSDISGSLHAAKSACLEDVQMRISALSSDSRRRKLVSDTEFAKEGLDFIRTNQAEAERYKRAQQIHSEYVSLVNDYVSHCLDDVQKRFEEISDKVQLYFEHLERNTEGLGKPRLRLSDDQDRSVVLEVFFHGDTVDPAYKYLSESQLNSFGLAVFLASSGHLNKECPFLILDDVVNSFDSYKRPRLLDLIREHLKGRQVLLMTHDRTWRDLLQRSLPNWGRINFTGYKFGVGPMVKPGVTPLERISDALERDEPEEACGILARYMEDLLQEICHRFECEVKYNRRNEYTLDTLIDRFRVRVKKKLGEDHPLTQAISELFEKNAYRNWAIHCKNPETPIHKNEVQEVLANWTHIESFVTCQEKECLEILKYDSRGFFACRCGKTKLTRSN